MSSVLQRAAARLRGLANTWDHSRKVPVKPSGIKYHGTVTGSTLVGKNSLKRTSVLPLNNATQIRQYHKERIATATLSWSDRVQMAYERMVESIKETLNYSSDSNDGKVNPPFRGFPKKGEKRGDGNSGEKKGSGSKNDNKNSGGNEGGPPEGSGFPMWPIWGLIAGGIGYFIFSGPGDDVGLGTGIKEIDWNAFQAELLTQDEVEKLEVRGDRLYVYLKDARTPSFYIVIGSVETFERRLEQIQKEREVGLFERVPVRYVGEGFAPSIVGMIPGLIIFGLMLAFFRSSAGRSGGIFSVGGTKKSSLVSAESKPKVKFNDVAGLDEAKEEIMEFVSFLKDPKKYKALGAKIPRGALLVGPPGTGKTLLAKATAGEAAVPFFSMSGSDFVEMFVGVGPSRVRDLFAQARQKAPCIIFIDEIDAVGRQRSKSGFSNDERENTLNQLLVEMDGFNTTSSVVVLAGTNRADILDKALLRPGRFDRQVAIDPPDKKGRVEIFKVHVKPIKLEEGLGIDFVEKLASLTPGFVGADIANVCNEAALIAARNGKKSVGIADFEAAIDRVIGGLERKTKVLAPKEKTTVAYHEAGHAVAGWFLQHANPLLKLSIIPRGSSALGYAQYQPKDQYLYSKEQLFDQMCMTLGGRCAEALIFNRISSGAEDDLQKITKMAHGQVTRYGMSDRIGLVSFAEDKSSEGPSAAKIYSADTARMVDEEIREMINKAYDYTYKLLEKHREGLEVVAKRLIDKEVLHEADLIELLGKRPWASKPAEVTGGAVETLDGDIAKQAESTPQ